MGEAHIAIYFCRKWPRLRITILAYAMSQAQKIFEFLFENLSDLLMEYTKMTRGPVA